MGWGAPEPVGCGGVMDRRATGTPNRPPGRKVERCGAGQREPGGEIRGRPLAAAAEE